jgi:hypothetical protein
MTTPTALARELDELRRLADAVDRFGDMHDQAHPERRVLTVFYGTCSQCPPPPGGSRHPGGGCSR